MNYFFNSKEAQGAGLTNPEKDRKDNIANESAIEQNSISEHDAKLLMELTETLEKFENNRVLYGSINYCIMQIDRIKDSYPKYEEVPEELKSNFLDWITIDNIFDMDSIKKELTQIQDWILVKPKEKYLEKAGEITKIEETYDPNMNCLSRNENLLLTKEIDKPILDCIDQLKNFNAFYYYDYLPKNIRNSDFGQTIRVRRLAIEHSLTNLEAFAVLFRPRIIEKIIKKTK